MESTGLLFMDKTDICKTARKFFESERLKLEKEKEEVIYQKKKQEEDKIKAAVKKEHDRILKCRK